MSEEAQVEQQNTGTVDFEEKSTEHLEDADIVEETPEEGQETEEKKEEDKMEIAKKKVIEGLTTAKVAVSKGVTSAKASAKVEYQKFKQTEVGSKIVGAADAAGEKIGEQYRRFKQSEVGQKLGDAAETTKVAAKKASVATVAMLKKGGSAFSSWVQKAKAAVQERISKDAPPAPHVEESD